MKNVGLDAKIEILIPFTYTFKVHQIITSSFVYPYIKGIQFSNIKRKTLHGIILVEKSSHSIVSNNLFMVKPCHCFISASCSSHNGNFKPTKIVQLGNFGGEVPQK
jgi:hypothetical protein